MHTSTLKFLFVVVNSVVFILYRIPQIRIVEAENGEKEIEVSDDPSDYIKLNADNIPVAVSLGKVGKCYIVDPSLEEEVCMQARVTVAVNSKGNICSVLKGSSQDASSAFAGVNPSELSQVIQSSMKIGLALMKNLQTLLDKEVKKKSSIL